MSAAAVTGTSKGLNFVTLVLFSNWQFTQGSGHNYLSSGGANDHTGNSLLYRKE